MGLATVHLRGIDITYERSGEGPRLLFINGTGASLATTGFVLDPFRPHFDLLSHDQRGLGATTVPDETPTMADYAEDAAAVAAHVGWDSYRLVGISFGGMVAQELAVTYPERIERLALLCTSPGGHDEAGESLASYPLHELAERPLEERLAIGQQLLDTRFTDEYLAADPTAAFLAQAYAQASSAPRSPEQERGAAMQLAARSGHDVLDRLGRITCPTLVTAGRFDGLAPPSNSEAIVARIPGAELRLYDGGHLFGFQDPAATPDLIEFLATP